MLCHVQIPIAVSLRHPCSPMTPMVNRIRPFAMYSILVSSTLDFQYRRSYFGATKTINNLLAKNKLRNEMGGSLTATTWQEESKQTNEWSHYYLTAKLSSYKLNNQLS